MPKLWTILNNFTGGEVSPEVWGRTETDQWPTMLEEMRNMFCNPRGGAQRRDGMRFVLPTKNPEENSRLVPFVFSRDQSYVLEFGDRYVRFFRDSGWVENVDSVKSFIGDGTSTKYLYPFPAIPEEEVVILKNGVKLTPVTDYVLTPANLTTSQIDDFTATASWDVNYAGDGETPADLPWVLNANTAASPAGAEPVLRQSDVNIARGSLVDFSFMLDSFTYTLHQVTDTLVQDEVLTQDYVEYLTGISDGGDYQALRINLDITFTTDLPDTITARLEFGSDLDGWVAYAATEELVDGTYTWSIVDKVIDASISGEGEFRVVANAAIATVGPPTVNTNPTMLTDSTVTVDLLVDYYAKLYVQLVNAQDEADVIPIDVKEIGAGNGWGLQDAEVVNNYPLRLKFYTDAGLEVQISDPLIINKRDGWEITFTTPPANTDIIVVLDGRSIEEGKLRKAGEVVSKQRLLPTPLATEDANVFEIESPFSADELDELYYVQANDIMIFCHQSHKPWRLTRNNPYDWEWDQPTLEGAPWEDAQYSPVNGYPRVVTFFQERLWFAATIEKPQTLWGSRTADFYDFVLPADVDPYKPDDSVEYTIAAYTHESIEWMASERVLIIGTSQTEHRLAPDQFIASDRLPTVSRMSAFGGAHVMPVFMGSVTAFVQFSGNQIRSYEQSGQSVIEKWESAELDWKATHLTKAGIKQMAYALNPHSQLFAVTNAGDILAMSYEPITGEQAQVGFGLQQTDGKVKSICSIPEADYEQVWMITERTIDDLDNPIYDESDPPNIIGYEQISQRYVEFYHTGNYTDSCLTYPDIEDVDPPALNAVGNLGHLEGKTVTVKVDGSTHPDRVVVNGEIELNDYYSEIEVGLQFIPRLKLQRFAIAAEQSNLQGQKGRWSQVFLRVVESANPKVNGIRQAERHPATPMNTSEPLETGDSFTYNLGWDRSKQLVIEQDLPLPLHITAIFGIMTINQG